MEQWKYDMPIEGGWGGAEEKRESDIVSEGKVEALGSTKTPVGLRWPEG